MVNQPQPRRGRRGHRWFFKSGILELGEKLGPVLWQFAPFKKFDADDLGGFLRAAAREAAGRPLLHVVEVRHESFLVPEFAALLREHNVAVVYADSDDYPAIADVTADFVYARLQRTRGEYRHRLRRPPTSTAGRRAPGAGQRAACPTICRASHEKNAPKKKRAGLRLHDQRRKGPRTGGSDGADRAGQAIAVDEKECRMPVKHDHVHLNDLHHELHNRLPPEPALRVRALESLLVEKGMLDPKTVDAWIETYTEEIGPKCGARVVAHAWIDPRFKARLLKDGTAGITELGLEGWAAAHLTAVENTPAVHNLVVCTLCSCYPIALLGMSPTWYKTAAYRARAVREPRSVLAEFGVTIPDSVEVRVWDSTAELRYLVLPERPAGTEGWDEDRLARLVTRNSMIGTQRVLAANPGGA